MDCKTIMVHLELGRDNSGLLEIVSDLAVRSHAGVIGIAACQPIQVFFDEACVSGEVLAQDYQDTKKQLQEAEDHFRSFMAGRTAHLEWRSTITIFPLADYIAHQARAADLIVTGRDIGGTVFDTTRRVPISDLVMQAGRPVLIVPDHRKELDLNRVMVGWKGTRESRRAIADALPLLKQAGHVTVVEIAPEAEIARVREHLDDVTDWLGRHGITAKSLAVPAMGEDSARLSDIAHEKGANLLVAGAYGHSRVREWVLGGVTKDFLLNPNRCVFLSH